MFRVQRLYGAENRRYLVCAVRPVCGTLRPRVSVIAPGSSSPFPSFSPVCFVGLYARVSGVDGSFMTHSSREMNMRRVVLPAGNMCCFPRQSPHALVRR